MVVNVNGAVVEVEVEAAAAAAVAVEVEVTMAALRNDDKTLGAPDRGCCPRIYVRTYVKIIIIIL